jgi:hypothetical protein
LEKAVDALGIAHLGRGVAVRLTPATPSASSSAASMTPVMPDARASVGSAAVMADTGAAAIDAMSDIGAAAPNDAPTPSIPTNRAAPTEAMAPSITAPAPAGAFPTSVIPAVAMTAVDVCDVFNRRRHLNVAGDDAIAYRGFGRISERHCRGGENSERETSFRNIC